MYIQQSHWSRDSESISIVLCMEAIPNRTFPCMEATLMLQHQPIRAKSRQSSTNKIAGFLITGGSAGGMMDQGTYTAEIFLPRTGSDSFTPINNK